MERGSDKHGARLDDELKHEDEPLVRSGQAPHKEDFRETEPLGDYPGTGPTDDASLGDQDETPLPPPGGDGPDLSESFPPSAAEPDQATLRDLDPDAR